MAQMVDVCGSGGTRRGLYKVNALDEVERVLYTRPQGFAGILWLLSDPPDEGTFLASLPNFTKNKELIE